MCEHMCTNRRCAACSELRIVHVSVLCGVRAIVRNVLQVVHVSVPQPNVRGYEVQDTYPLQKMDIRTIVHTNFFRKTLTTLAFASLLLPFCFF